VDVERSDGIAVPEASGLQEREVTLASCPMSNASKVIANLCDLGMHFLRRT